jgi:hypothetical protein
MQILELAPYLLPFQRLARFAAALFHDGTAVALLSCVERKECFSPRTNHITGNNKHDSSVESCFEGSAEFD